MTETKNNTSSLPSQENTNINNQETLEEQNSKEITNPKELSYIKEKEYILRKGKINKIIYEIKYNRDYLQAAALIEESNIGFEEIMNSTVKLTLEDLLILIEKIMTKK